MKKKIALLLTSCMVAGSLVGCSGTTESIVTSDTNVSVEETIEE